MCKVKAITRETFHDAHEQVGACAAGEFVGAIPCLSQYV